MWERPTCKLLQLLLRWSLTHADLQHAYSFASIWKPGQLLILINQMMKRLINHSQARQAVWENRSAPLLVILWHSRMHWLYSCGFNLEPMAFPLQDNVIFLGVTTSQISYCVLSLNHMLLNSSLSFLTMIRNHQINTFSTIFFFF